MQKFYYRHLDDGTWAITEYHGDEAEVILPTDRTITVLFDNLFKGHSEITSIQIPDTVTDFGEFLFDGCDNLTEIKLPKDLTTLWGYSFTRSSFEELILPEGLRRIPPFAFKDCKNLKRVVCGKGLKKISAWAFGGCDKLEQVLYGPGVDLSPEAFMTKELNTWKDT